MSDVDDRTKPATIMAEGPAQPHVTFSEYSRKSLHVYLQIFYCFELTDNWQPLYKSGRPSNSHYMLISTDR
jgi:hypothetical protein